MIINRFKQVTALRLYGAAIACFLMAAPQLTGVDGLPLADAGRQQDQQTATSASAKGQLAIAKSTQDFAKSNSPSLTDDNQLDTNSSPAQLKSVKSLAGLAPQSASSPSLMAERIRLNLANFVKQTPQSLFMEQANKLINSKLQNHPNSASQQAPQPQQQPQQHHQQQHATGEPHVKQTGSASLPPVGNSLAASGAPVASSLISPEHTSGVGLANPIGRARQSVPLGTRWGFRRVDAF